MTTTQHILPGTHAWLEARRKYVCSTDVPKIMGKSRYGGPYEVCLHKWNEEPPAGETSEVAHRGLILEKAVAMAYSVKNGVTVTEPFFCIHPEHDFMAGTPDGRIKDDDKKHIQIKTHDYAIMDEYGADGTDQVPNSEFLQVSHEMAVLGTEAADLVVLFGTHREFRLLVYMVNEFWNSAQREKIVSYILENMDFKTYSLYRNPDMEAKMIEVERHFWETFVVPHELPPTAPVYKDSGLIRNAAGHEADAIEKLRDRYLAVKRADAAFEIMKAHCVKLIGKDKGIDCPAVGKITYKTGTNGKLSWKGVAEDLRIRHAIKDGEWNAAIKKNTTLPTRSFSYPDKRWSKEL